MKSKVVQRNSRRFLKIGLLRESSPVLGSTAAFVNVVVASPQAAHCNASGRILSGFNQT